MLSRVSRLSFPFLLSTGLAYAIFQDGGVVTWGWNICLLITGLVAATYWAVTPASELEPALSPWLRRGLLFLPCYVALQLVPLPLSLLKILSPARARLVDQLGAVMARPEFATLSIAPFTTYSFLLRLASYIVVFLLVREITRRTSKECPWISFAPLIVIGVLEAALGLSQNGEGTDAVGSYANHNHFAGLLEMILPGAIACGIMLAKEDGFRRPSLLRTLGSCAFFLGATAMFVAILYSQSKMGFVATLGGLLAMALALALALGTGPKNTLRKWLGAAALAVVLLGAFIFLPSNQVINGFGNLADDNTAEGRLPVVRDSLHLIADYPIFGTGLGTYSSAFVKYQTANGDVSFTYAHNDYLQLLSELGLLGFTLLACWAIPTFNKAYRTVVSGQGRNSRYLALGCIGGMVAIGIHSLADFNLYLPANAMVLVWIAGIVAGLPPAFKSAVTERVETARFPQKAAMIALSCALIAFAVGGLVFETTSHGNARTESWYCRFGVCDIDSVLAAETAAPGGNSRPASLSTLIEAVHRDPAAPGRWSDLGDAFYQSGKIEQARLSFSNALALGPNVAPTLLAAAEFYQKLGEENRALDLASRALALTTIYTNAVFDWFEAAKLPASQVLLRGLPEDPSIYRAYLRYVRDHGEVAATEQVWSAALSHGYVDEPFAREYVDWVYGRGDYETAAKTWAAYLGDRGQGYLKSNWIFNGDFESEISQSPLDWAVDRTDDVEVERDGETQHSGKYSLRINLAGKQNLSAIPVSQRAVVTPGRYRFEAYLKTKDLSTDRGVSLHIADQGGASRLNWTMEPLLGTNEWRKVSTEFCVAPQTKLVVLNLVRQPSLKFDNLIKGTLWIDSVSLLKLSPTCF